MKLFILAIGTRGDFELFLFLGQALQARGHQVTIASSPFYAPYVQAEGMDWMTVGDGTLEEMRAILRDQTEVADRTLRVWGYINRWLQPQVMLSYDQIQARAWEADYFINNLRVVFYRPNGEAVPGATVAYDPPTEVENDIWTQDAQQPPGKILNLVSLNKRLTDPRDLWGPRYKFTGYWKPPRPTAAEPSAELRAFLKAGPPPVVITLGSMVMFDGDEVAEVISQSLELAGQRGVIVGGWSEVSQAAHWSGSVLCVREAPYEWLFPQAACVIHHGGTGTVGAVLRAGKVSIILPQVKCQEIYGWTLGKNGLATGVFEITNLYPPELAEAIQEAISNEQFQQNARTWQQIIAADPGIEGAADLIEEHWQQLGTGDRTGG